MEIRNLDYKYNYIASKWIFLSSGSGRMCKDTKCTTFVNLCASSGPPERWLWASCLYEDRWDCCHRRALRSRRTCWGCELDFPGYMCSSSSYALSLDFEKPHCYATWYTWVFIQYHQPWYFHINKDKVTIYLGCIWCYPKSSPDTEKSFKT